MRIEIPEVKKLVYEMRFPVRWGDMDAMGHVNNTVYFRYLETARIEWMVSVGCNPDPKGQGPVIVNAFCNFYKQLEYPADVLLKLYVSDPGRTTFETWGQSPDGAVHEYALSSPFPADNVRLSYVAYLRQLLLACVQKM